MAGRFGERIMIAIILANGVSVIAIGARAAELLDPRMLVRRHALGGELAADPIGLFCKNDAHSVAQSGQGGGASTDACADNRDVSMKFAGGGGGDERGG